MPGKIIYIAGLIIMLLLSVRLGNLAENKYHINRWVIACAAPLVLIIPGALFKNLSGRIWNILLIIFSVMCIMFFEMSRIKLEKYEIKGILYNGKKGKYPHTKA